MRILFISQTQRLENPYQDHSTRYRCFHFGEELCLSGFDVGIVPQKTVPLSAVDDYDFFVFQRPQYSRKLVDLLNRLRSCGKQFCADFDDLLFCLDSAHESPQVLNGRMTHRAAARRQRQYQQALLQFDRVTVSTTALAREVKKHHPAAQVQVVANGLPQNWAKSQQSDERSGIFRIGYFPGTSSHSDDFKLVAATLERFLGDHPAAELMLVGPLEIPNTLQRLKQVVQVASVPYTELGNLLDQCAVTLAPLADTRFNRCKSNIKLLESLACGAPLIASPNEDFGRLEGDYLSIAMDESGWERALKDIFQLWEKGQLGVEIPWDKIMVNRQINSLLEGWGRPNLLRSVHDNHSQGSLTVFGTMSPKQGRRYKVGRKFFKLVRNPEKFFRDSWLLKCFKP